MPVPLFSLNWSLGRSCALNNTGLRGKILGSSGGRTVSRWLLPPWGRLRPRTKFCAIQLFARPSGIQPCPLLCPSRSQPKPHPFPMSSPSQGLPLSAPALLHHPTPLPQASSRDQIFPLVCQPIKGFTGGSSSKEPTCQCRRCWRQGFSPCVRKISWRRPWQPTPVFLPGESHGQGSLAGYIPWGRKESNMTAKSLT